MIAQQELQTLLALADEEKISLMHCLLESLGPQTTTPPVPTPALSATEQAQETTLPPAVIELLSLVEPAEVPNVQSALATTGKIPFLSLAGIFSGGAGGTAERADEICRTEIKRRSGFTLKVELPE